ncbi:uncharacterized protein LOC130993022 [Salvia miltiorrhiza]|uniref:uncharacterized protein LOC130993022 n=1 Tax=Salvia miltiorrhiza TaxID=226208 RepID=UPI0025AB9DA6|nr:uncharacterized protein LOC130993022 [Salvia miltiorrhiza]
MTSERDDSLQSINVRLNGKNYSYWSYVMKNFLRGKKLWGYVSGTHCKPIEENNAKYVEELDSWEVCNSKIITWINNSVENSIDMQLAKYDTAKEVCEHLGKLYTQSNFARQYQLEMDIRSLNQRDMSIQEFYTSMTDLWDQLALTESIQLKAFAPYIARREEQRLVQFLMALRDDFEGLRGNILHRNPLPLWILLLVNFLLRKFDISQEQLKAPIQHSLNLYWLLTLVLNKEAMEDLRAIIRIRIQSLIRAFATTASSLVIGRLSALNWQTSHTLQLVVLLLLLARINLIDIPNLLTLLLPHLNLHR